MKNGVLIVHWEGVLCRVINKMISKFSIKEIVNLISSNNKVPKKEIYNYCLNLKNEI